MTTLTSTARAGTANIAAAPGGRSSAIKAWAVVGAAFLALQLYVYGAWILSGDATPTPTGVTPVPTWMKWSLHGQEAFCVGLMVFFFYRFVYRPYRRDGKIGLDGLFVLAYPTLYWQDPLQNYIQPHATYNAEFVNLGAWTAHIPGWISPRSNLLAEPLLYAGPLYVIWIFGATVLACALMRRAKARWPHRGPLFLIGACFSFFFVFDFVSEVIFMRLGMYTYAGSIHAWTFFQGHYYQFPFYALLTYPVMATAFTVPALLPRRPGPHHPRAGRRPAPGRRLATERRPVPRPDRRAQRADAGSLQPPPQPLRHAQRVVARGHPEPLLPHRRDLRSRHALCLSRTGAPDPPSGFRPYHPGGRTRRAVVRSDSVRSLSQGDRRRRRRLLGRCRLRRLGRVGCGGG